MKILLVILLTLCTLPIEAVEIYSRKLNTSNGLPDDNIRSLAQDDKGFIWMGTPTGLYRYDGYFFTTYKYAETGNMRLLNNNHISGCYRLADGRMLFSEKGGLYSVFDTKRNMFVDMPVRDMEQMYRKIRQHDIPQKVMERYWHILENGGNCIGDNLGNSIVLDRSGQIWFIDRRTGENIHMTVFDEQLFSVISSLKYKVQTSERTGLIWVSTNGCGITVYDRNTHEEHHIRQSSGLISTDYIQDICLDKNDNLWAADEFHGVVCLNAVTKQSVTRLLEPLSSGLRSNQVRVMHRVNDSLLWLANTQGSVYQVDARLNVKKVMDKIDVHCMTTDRSGNVWIGTRTQGLRLPDGTWLSAAGDAIASLSSNNVSALLYDMEDHLWVGCEDARLDVIDFKGQHPVVRHFLPKNASPKVIVTDKKGYMWVGTKTGLYKFKPRQLLADSTKYEQPMATADIKYSDVNCIYEDPQGRLWIGTSGDGLYRTDDAGATFSHITMADGLIGNEIQSLYATHDGTLWVATTKGITRYQISDGHCQYIYNERNLLRNYYAEGCVSTTMDNRMVFGTNQGIVLYNINTRNDDARHIEPVVTDVLVNGASIGPAEGQVELPYDQNSLTFHFSTFSYSGSTRYSYMLDDYDRQWSEPSPYSFASYKNLPPGKYTLYIKTYDNNILGTSSQQLIIVIRHPWWLTWWAFLIYFVLAAALGYAVYRQLRTVYNLRRRISIERELTEYKLLFFTNISHEFRTPLTIIRGAMERIRSVAQVPSEMRQPLSSMGKSVDRMLRLINQLLEFRKMQNGKLRLALEDTDIVAFVKDIIYDFNDMADAKHISYTFLPSVKSYMMPIDRQHVDKIVYNLLSNAIKYTPAKGSVTVRLRVDDPMLTISVEDTGVGIPPEKQTQLFQRFMQSSFSNDSIGIGLHLTKALVDTHHGTISYASGNTGGSVFTVQLPTNRDVYTEEDFIQQSALHDAQQEAVKQKSINYKELATEPMNERRVLIVEDDIDVAEYLKQLLGHYFMVSVAIDGKAALEGINREGVPLPDLIVSDIMMPVMNGYEFTRQLRDNLRTSTIPIILLTALNSENTHLKGIERGADAYLTKPFDPKLLVSTCRQLLERYDRLRNTTSEQPATRVIAPPEIIVDERDKKLLEVMNTWLYDHIGNPMLSVDELAETMGYGRSVFYKKVKSLTGQTPADYIRTLRMDRAAELLREETITVAEVCYKVGISDPHYFTKIFKQQFGISPKKYQQGKKKSEENQ